MNIETLTSDVSKFKEQLDNPNKPFNFSAPQGNVVQIRKNLILSFVSDATGCGHIRNIFPLTYLNAIYGNGGRLHTCVMPFFTFQEDILLHSKALFFQRQMSPHQIPAIQRYRSLKDKYKFKMVYDIDDYIYRGEREGESIPEYNFGSEGITDEVRKASVEIMNMMDTVCVSTEFLGQCLKEQGVKTEIKVVQNTVPVYFWGSRRRSPITEKIERPKIILTQSPTHYHQGKKLLGDWENSWLEYIIKNVKENKIEVMCMGGLPFFFEELNGRDNFHVLQWLNSYQYHLPILDFQPHFNICPLVPNYFNYCKSDLKAIEAYASGAVAIGTSPFKNKMPSPYDKIFVRAKEGISLNEIEELIDFYCYPSNFNDIISKQYNFMHSEGRYLEDPKYINYLVSIFNG